MSTASSFSPSSFSESALKDSARATINLKRSTIEHLSHQIHEFKEINFAEYKSADTLRKVLADGGFKIENVVDLPTAFVARKGNGSLNIGICAEYDALPEVGHACGHNIIAAAAVGAGIALGELTDTLDMTVTVLGTPAEEGGGGKILMLQRGAFDNLHAAMMVHPSRIERDAMATLAVSQFIVEYEGKAAHAAANPDRGINAASALVLAQNGIGMLREHLSATDRLHGIVISGGEAPNIIPSNAKGIWYARSSTMEHLSELEEKVINVFKGAATMTGCSLSITKEAPTFAELKTDERLAELWRNNARKLGRIPLPIQPSDGPASTDMGNVSYAVPSIHPLIAIESNGANIHERAFADAASTKSGDQATIDGAVAMAWTAIDIATNSQLRNQLQQHPYSVADVPVNKRDYLGIENYSLGSVPQ